MPGTIQKGQRTGDDGSRNSTRRVMSRTKQRVGSRGVLQGDVAQGCSRGV